MKQKHADSPSAFLAAAMAVTGAAMLLCPLIGQNTEMNRSAAEYDDLRVQLKSEEPAQATDAQENRSTLRQMFDAAGFPSTTQVPLELPEQAPEIDVGTGADLAACLAQNDDFIAWIKIPGTNVDYPVVQTDDPDDYLNHTFSGKSSVVGTLFSLADADYAAPGRNIAIYGHHLRSSGEKMFTSLMRYKNPDFYEDNQTIVLDSLYRHSEYTIFAVVNMKAGDWEPSRTMFSGDAAFMAFVNRAKSESLYDTGVEVGADDHILTLITCDRSYAGKEGRLVILAVER